MSTRDVHLLLHWLWLWATQQNVHRVGFCTIFPKGKYWEAHGTPLGGAMSSDATGKVPVPVAFTHPLTM